MYTCFSWSRVLFAFQSQTWLASWKYTVWRSQASTVLQHPSIFRTGVGTTPFWIIYGCCKLRASKRCSLQSDVIIKPNRIRMLKTLQNEVAFLEYNDCWLIEFNVKRLVSLSVSNRWRIGCGDACDDIIGQIVTDHRSEADETCYISHKAKNSTTCRILPSGSRKPWTEFDKTWWHGCNA